MTESSSTIAMADDPIFTGGVDEGAAEPSAALIVGGAAGAACFALCVLLIGPLSGIAIALIGAGYALAKRDRAAATIFVAAAAFAGVALLPLTIAIFVASLAFGVALALAARAHARVHSPTLS